MTTTTTTSTSSRTAAASHRVLRRSEPECRIRARRLLETLSGSRSTDLTWDDTYRLLGHVHVGRRELILIASRDDAHQPAVLTVEDWDELRHESRNPAALIAEHAISTRHQLESLIDSLNE